MVRRPLKALRGGRVAEIVALAGHAVVLGRVPGHDGLPHVVVGVVPVLVVREGRGRRGRPARAQRSRPARSASPRTRPSGTGEQLGHPEGQRPAGPGGPLLQIGHLEPGGRVDPVGCLEQAGQEHRPEVGAGVVGARWPRARRRCGRRSPVGSSGPPRRRSSSRTRAGRAGR